MNRPETRMKKEYHRRVSPIVRKGGRSRVAQSMAMKPAMARMATDIVATATVLRSFFIMAHVDAVAAISITIPAHKGKMFQLIILSEDPL